MEEEEEEEEDRIVPPLDLDLVVGKLLGIRYFDNVYHYPLSFS